MIQVRAIPALVLALSATRVLPARDVTLSQVLIDGEDWEVDSEGHAFTEGPAADADGYISFSDVRESKIYKIGVRGNVSPFGAETLGSDRMAVDRYGRLYGATRAGLQMFDPTGRMGGVILKPQPSALSNATFGGKERDILYVTCSDKVYRRRTKTQGVSWNLAAEE